MENSEVINLLCVCMGTHVWATVQLNMEPKDITHGKYAALEPTAAANAVARANKSRGSSRRANEPEVIEMEARG